MADVELVQELAQTVSLCLSSKLRKAHDASAQLTIDIARQLAEEIEARCQDYTNLEVSKLMSTVHDLEVDLGDFREFINDLSSTLSGEEESTEELSLFRLLVTDTEVIKEETKLNTNSISDIKSWVQSINETLLDHEDRITTLESLEKPDQIKDDVIQLIETIFQNACLSVSDTLEEYRKTRSDLLVSNLRHELTSSSKRISLELLPTGDILLTCLFDKTTINQVNFLVNDKASNYPTSMNNNTGIINIVISEDPKHMEGMSFVVITTEGTESENHYGTFPSPDQYPNVININ